MSHWNHRVIEFVEADGTPWMAIHEVHYDDAGRPYAYAENAAEVCGESNDELRKTLDWMRAALDQPALVETDFKEGQVEALAAEIAVVLDAEQIAARL